MKHIIIAFCLVACGSDFTAAQSNEPDGGHIGSDDAGKGGTTSTGGATDTGGTSVTVGTGGKHATGGVNGSTGGTTNLPPDSGGIVATGDASPVDSGMGGVLGTGGAMSTGGTVATGGAVNAGGTTSTGGTVSAGGTTGVSCGGLCIVKGDSCVFIPFSGPATPCPQCSDGSWFGESHCDPGGVVSYTCANTGTLSGMSCIATSCNTTTGKCR